MNDENARQTVVPESPYPGIDPYTYAERDVFFAREAESRKLARLIVLYRGVLLYSDSGNGKSSLINAGLTPLAIQEGYQPQRIRVQPRSGEEIVVERISESADSDQRFLPSVLAPDETQQSAVLSVEKFLDVLRQRAAEAKPLLVFDQFEEWVTLFEEKSTKEGIGQQHTIQGKICDAIASLINDTTLPVKVLISLREDYLAKLAPLFKRCPNIPDQYLRLVPLSGDQIYRVIRGPFDRYPGRYPQEINSTLAKKIQAQFESRSGGASVRLTEIQIVCRKLFESWTTGEDLEELFTTQNGVEGILEKYLEQALESLDSQQREPAVCLLTRMITSAGTRMVIPEDDLLTRAEHEEGIPRKVLGKTIVSLEQRAKLIQREVRRDVSYCEIASEFLVGWIGRKAQEHRLQAEQKKFEHLQHARRRRLAVGIGVGFLLALAILAAVFLEMRFVRKGHESESRHLADLAGQVLSRSKAESLVLAQLAVSETYFKYKIATPEAEMALRRAVLANNPAVVGPQLTGFNGQVNEMLFSSNGNRLASVSSDNSVTVWDLDSNKSLFTSGPQTSRPVSLAINPDGSCVAIVDKDHRVHFWDLSSLSAVLSSLPADDRKLRGFSFTREVKGLEVDDAVAKVRNSISGQLAFTLRLRFDAVSPLALSGDGQRLATTNAFGAMRVWDTQSGQELWTVPANGNVVIAAFSSDGKWLAVASRYGVDLMICDVVKRHVAYKLLAPRPGFTAFTINSEGTRLAIGYADKIPHAIELVKGQKARPRPRTAAFSADGKHLAIANQDGAVKVLDSLSRNEEGAPLPEQTDVVQVASSSDGSRLVTASKDGTVKVWNALSGKVISTHSGLGTPLNFSPDSTRLATAGSENGTVNVWDTSSGEKLRTIRVQGQARLATFCPDNTRLLTHSDEKVQIWDLPSAVEPKELHNLSRDLRAVAFSPNCGLLATASGDGSVRLWDASDGANKGNFSGSPPQMLTFGPDGTRLAVAHEDRTLTVVDTTDGRRLNTLATNGSQMKAMSFDPAGRDIATVTEEGDISIDVLSVEDLMAAARQQPHSSLTLDECKRLSLHQKLCEALDWAARAEKLAVNGQLPEAIAAFKKAKSLDSTLPYDPKMEARRLVAQVRLAEGRKLTVGNLTEATKKFEEAKLLDPSLRIDPQTEGERIVVQKHVLDGRNLATEGKLPEATREFQQAKLLDPSLQINPEAEANSWAAREQVSKGLDLAQKGNIKEAVTAFGIAQKLDSTKITGESWNNLCWAGSVGGHADQVLSACEKALALEPGNWHFRDSRGLARSLTGNKTGAILDFRAYVEQAENARLKSQRQDWIAALRRGKNPFSPTVLKNLAGQ
jgi:WD40 repeat protein/tetratricopeptide (TPR) repeat protein